MTIKDKVVIVTGASSGIGLATARLLLAGEAKLALSARHIDDLKPLQDEYGDNVLIQKVDVSQYDQVKSHVDDAVEKFGHIDAIFNNAGIMPVSSLREKRISDWQDMVNTNIMGVLNGIAATLPLMEEQGHGHILATDSTAGHTVFPTFSVYSGTKFAVRAIMEGLRQEENDKNIKSTVITPGTVKTNLYKTIPDEQGQQNEITTQENTDALTPEDLAEAVKFALDTPDRVSLSELYMRPTKQIP